MNVKKTMYIPAGIKFAADKLWLLLPGSCMPLEGCCSFLIVMLQQLYMVLYFIIQ